MAFFVCRNWANVRKSNALGSLDGPLFYRARGYPAFCATTNELNIT